MTGASPEEESKNKVYDTKVVCVPQGTGSGLHYSQRVLLFYTEQPRCLASYWYHRLCVRIA